MKALLILTLLMFSLDSLAASKLVSQDAIDRQVKTTTKHKLKNGIPVLYRNIEGSDILEVSVSFSSGLKDLPEGKKALSRWFWSLITMGSTEFPKAKTFELVEKYALEIGCTGGIEYSTCGLGTLNDHVNDALPLFASLIKNPAFAKEDIDLTKSRLEASLKSAPSDPGSFVNEVVNRIYYPKGHPYRLNHDEALEELNKLGAKELKEYHTQILNADIMSIVVVGSVDINKFLRDLDKTLGDVGKRPVLKTNVKAPKYDHKKAFEIEDRDIPTAYIRAKFTAPSVDDKDAIASKLMFEILSEELGEEIRTKRSLSYSVYSFVIQYSMGIGVLSASTSKPKETLEAMHDVVQKLKTKKYTQAELDQYKNVFATGYFLTQETHSSLASAIGSAMFFYDDVLPLYEFPKKLDAVTPEDIQRLAKRDLVDMTVGVIFNKAKFESKWATDFIGKHQSTKKTH